MENTANSGSGQLRIYGLGVIAGLVAVGYVQAAGLLMGPFQVIFLGMSLVTVPEATRILRNSPRHLWLYCVAVGTGLAILALAWGGLVLVALPRGLGNLLLGKELWRPASGLVIPYMFSMMGYCVIVGATAGLHALGVAKRSLHAMVITSILYLCCGLAGAGLDGATGSVRGTAVAAWLGAVVWWWHLRVAMRESDKIPAHGLNWPGRRREAAEQRVPSPSPLCPVRPTGRRRRPAIHDSVRFLHWPRPFPAPHREGGAVRA